MRLSIFLRYLFFAQATAWGVFILILQPFGSAHGFITMAAIGDEWVWAFFCMVPGLIGLYATVTRKWTLTRPMHWWLMTFFVFVAVVFGISNWRSTAIPTYPFIAAVHGALAIFRQRPVD